jgi:hypothetical protein
MVVVGFDPSKKTFPVATYSLKQILDMSAPPVKELIRYFRPAYVAECIAHNPTAAEQVGDFWADVGKTPRPVQVDRGRRGRATGDVVGYISGRARPVVVRVEGETKCYAYPITSISFSAAAHL